MRALMVGGPWNGKELEVRDGRFIVECVTTPRNRYSTLEAHDPIAVADTDRHEYRRTTRLRDGRWLFEYEGYVRAV